MDLNKLTTQFRGEILIPGTPQYEASRKIWNGMIDRRPSAIARCSGPADVLAAVRFAAEQDLTPAVRGGGHNVAGLAMLDDGLVIDLSPMKGIFIDPQHQTVTAQTGLTWGEFDRETALYGLATTGGLISTTGMSGLTLGGGVGWLMGECGLACDDTLAYDVALANGGLRSRQRRRTSRPVLGLERRQRQLRCGHLHHLPHVSHRPVISGMVLHPLEHARDVMKFYRDFVISDLPDELTVYAAASSTPDGQPVIALLPAWCGQDLPEGQRLLEPLRTFGSPIADLVSVMSYPAMQQMIDAVAPHGRRSYWKSRFLRGLPDAAIDPFVRFAESRTSPLSMAVIEHAHGAVARVAPDATAFPSRDDPFDLVLISAWTDPAQDARHIDWTRQFHAAMEPWSAGLVYVNSLDQDDAGRIPEAYGPNYSRLAAVKAAYDPGNRFRRNQNIQPRA